MKPLAFADIAADFGEGFLYLADIGRRIDQARNPYQVEALVNCALQLLYAEKASGKTSRAVTGRQMLTEATEWAMRREDSKLVRRLAALWGDEALGLGDKTRQAELITAAREMDAQTRASLVSGDILFENNTIYWLSIYINGRFYGFVLPRSTRLVNDVWTGPCQIRTDAGFDGYRLHELQVKPNTRYRLVLNP